MNLNLRNVKVVWINVDADQTKRDSMVSLFERIGIENHTRFSAITDIEPHENCTEGEKHYRNCAESHFGVLSTVPFPALILEDDVRENDNFTLDLTDVPDDADALYLGTSHGDGSYECEEYNAGWCRINRVFATHAILYINKNYARETIEVGKNWIYEKEKPFDVGLAYDLQSRYNVYAPKVPMFYQSDELNEVNKWEKITRTPLQTKKKFSIFTL